jgi:ribosomal subunit interface protein
MTIRVTGKHFDLGEAMRTHILEKIDAAIGKYFNGQVSGHVVVDHEGSGYRSDCTLHLSSGITLHSEGRAHEPYASFDQAAERLEKRLRRYKRRLKEHHTNHAAPRADDTMANYVLEAPDQEAEESHEFNAVIVAEQVASLRTLAVSSAVLELDMTGAPVVVFRHAGTKRINVVYRRGDGNVGWLDPGGDGEKPSRAAE